MFKPEQEMGSPKKTFDPDVQIQEKNVEKKSLTPEIIKKIYEKGRKYILAGTLALIGLHTVNDVKHYETPEEVYKSFDARFKNIDSAKSHQIFDDLRNIMSEAQLERYSPGDSIIPKVIMDDDLRQRIIEIGSLYNICDPYIFTQMSAGCEGKDLTDLKNKKIMERIKELRQEFPSDYNPSFYSLPIGGNLKDLEAPSYMKGIKRLANIAMTEGINWLSKEEIEYVGQNDEYYALLKKLNSFGTNFTAEVIRSTTDIYDKKDTLYVAQRKATLTEVEKFVLSENTKVLKYADKYSDMGTSILREIMEDTSGEYLKFFEDQKNKKSIDFLKKNGFKSTTFFYLLKEGFGPLINNPDFLDIAVSFSRDKNNPYDPWLRLSFLKPYYNLKTEDDFHKLKEDFEEIKNTKRDTWEKDFDRSYVGLFEEFMPEKIKTNIFDPLTVEMYGGHKQPNNFMEDPALGVVKKLGYEKTPPHFLDSFDLPTQADWIMRVARNMYITKEPITPENFEKTFYETIGLRMDKELIEKPLFKNRNVALFVNNEKWGDDASIQVSAYGEKNKGKDRFGKPEANNSILKQNPLELKTFRAEKTKESLEHTKKLFLEYVSSNPNLTIVVDAHGGSNNIFLTQGIPDKNGVVDATIGWESSITSEEIAAAFESRYDKGINDVPLILMASCYNQDFIRNLCQELIKINLNKNKNISLPIACGDAEYGQYGFGSQGDFGNDFLKLMLANKIETKLKDIIKIEGVKRTYPSVNISIFVPYTKETKDINGKKVIQKVFYQIAKMDATPMEKSEALNYANSLMDKNVSDGKTALYYEYVKPEIAYKIRNIVEEEEA